ncbi:MAG: cardiolipin synthase [Burkholderiales bacterium]
MRGVVAAGGRAKVLSAIALLFVAGCSALPKVTPDLSLRPSRHLRPDASAGLLSVERSRAFLDAQGRSGPENDPVARFIALEQRLVGTSLLAGNKVVLLQDGAATYDAMLAAIEGATNHIHLETYILDDDATGRRFADALIERQRAGVQVNLIYDGVGSFNTPRAFFQRLTDAGAHVLEYNPINPLTARKGWAVNQRDHRKLLIVDGRTAFLGGLNISGVYSSRSARRILKGQPVPRSLPWRDTHLQVQGPVVATFQRLFLDTWQRQKGPPLTTGDWFPPLPAAGGEVVRAIGSSPDEPYSLIYVTLISAINSAETEVLLTNAYFAPDPQLLAALKNAAARGVDVKLLLPGETDSALVFHAGRSYYRELLRAGVRIYERQAALLHAKTALIDGVWATVGSTNLDWRSFLHNQELNAVVVSAEFGARMRTTFRRDLAESNAITLDAWERRPMITRLKERLSRLWEYWL